jgi:hypothetical protein
MEQFNTFEELELLWQFYDALQELVEAELVFAEENPSRNVNSAFLCNVSKGLLAQERFKELVGFNLVAELIKSGAGEYLMEDVPFHEMDYILESTSPFKHRLDHDNRANTYRWFWLDWAKMLIEDRIEELGFFEEEEEFKTPT